MVCTKPIRLPSQGNLLVPCGKCRACRIARAKEWTVRIMHEINYHDYSYFVTLTYNDDNLPSDNSLSKQELQKFFKRLRKGYEPGTIKYYACGEYGEQYGRPHYHAIIMSAAEISKEVLQKNWSFGYVYVGNVTYDSARYTADYVQKQYTGQLAIQKYGTRQPPFSIKSLGLGAQFALDNSQQILDNLGITMRGDNVGIPRYYKKLIGLDSQNPDMVYRAQVRDAEIRQVHIERRGLLGQADSRVQSRNQADRNLNARLNQKKKGKL